jgi:DNA-binding response OmpR family regulator
MGALSCDVLIVDDDPAVADAIQSGVRLAGYTVCGIAATPRAALDLMRRHRPSLAIVDVDLGEEGSGIDVARNLLEIAPVGIIYITGFPDLVRDADVGHAWMAKPYRVLDLINSLTIIRSMAQQAPLRLPIPAGLHLIARDAPAGSRKPRP